MLLGKWIYKLPASNMYFRLTEYNVQPRWSFLAQHSTHPPVLRGMAINAHSYPLLWRIALSSVSTGLWNPQPITGYKGLPLYLKVGPPVWCDFHSRAYMGSGWSWALHETMFLYTALPPSPYPPPPYHVPLPYTLLSRTLSPYITVPKNQHPNPSSGSSREPMSDLCGKWNR